MKTDRETIIDASRCSSCEMNCSMCCTYEKERGEAVDCFGGSESCKCPFELGAEWAAEKFEREREELLRKAFEFFKPTVEDYMYEVGMDPDDEGRMEELYGEFKKKMEEEK